MAGSLPCARCGPGALRRDRCGPRARPCAAPRVRSGRTCRPLRLRPAEPPLRLAHVLGEPVRFGAEPAEACRDQAFGLAGHERMPRACRSSRRMASVKCGLGSGCSAIHASIARRSSGGRRRAVTGIWPVAGRPLFRRSGTDCTPFLSFKLASRARGFGLGAGSGPQHGRPMSRAEFSNTPAPVPVGHPCAFPSDRSARLHLVAELADFNLRR